MSGARVNTRSETTYEVAADANVSTRVETNVMTRSEQIARYLGDDLLYLVKRASIDLGEWLGVPTDYVRDPDYLVQMICADVELMLRNGLINGADIMVTDPQPDTSGQYSVRYLSRYLIEGPTEGNPVNPQPAKFWGGLIRPPDPTLASAFHFVFGIEWRPDVDQQARSEVRTPKYLFDWVPADGSYDSSQLVGVRYGGMEISGASVMRVEFIDPRTRTP